MLENAEVAARLPAQDLERARAFYAEKLGLEPVEERPGGLRYRCGNSYFVVFQSAGAASGTHTQMGWEVEDVEATVAALRARGVVFEEYDLPGIKTVNGSPRSRATIPAGAAWGRRAPGSGTARATSSASASRSADRASPGRWRESGAGRRTADHSLPGAGLGDGFGAADGRFLSRRQALR